MDFEGGRNFYFSARPKTTGPPVPINKQQSLSCCKYTKYQSFQYKIIHRIFPCNEWLTEMNIKTSSQCSFCEQNDSIQHYLTQCPKTLLFWKMFFKWWNSLDVPRISDIDMTNILFGYPENDKITNVLNYVLLIAKYHIYKQKQNKSQPFLPLR